MLSHVRQLHYLSILIAQIVLHLIIVFTQDHPLLILLFIVGLFGIFGTVISVIWNETLPRALALAFGIIAIASGIPLLFPGLSPLAVRASMGTGSLAYAGFILIATFSIGKSVFVSDRVTANRIVGGICVYLLIGTCFGFLFAGIALFVPGSLSLGPPEAPTIGRLNDLMYFSLSTLTTTGFGDIRPIHPFTKFLASFESIIGSIYVAVMIARLVGMHISQGTLHRQQG